MKARNLFVQKYATHSGNADFAAAPLKPRDGVLATAALCAYTIPMYIGHHLPCLKRIREWRYAVLSSGAMPVVQKIVSVWL